MNRTIVNEQQIGLTPADAERLLETMHWRVYDFTDSLSELATHAHDYEQQSFKEFWEELTTYQFVSTVLASESFLNQVILALESRRLHLTVANKALVETCLSDVSHYFEADVVLCECHEALHDQLADPFEQWFKSGVIQTYEEYLATDTRH